jgi:hypothetical protein
MTIYYSPIKNGSARAEDPRSKPPPTKMDEEKPPKYDHSKAVFIRDEKRAAMSEQEGDLLWSNAFDEDDLGPFMWNMIPLKMVLLVYTMITTVAQVLMFSFSLESGFTMESLSSLAYAMINVTGFTMILLRKSKEMMKPFLFVYTAYFLFGSVMSGYAIILLWSPNFCRRLSTVVKGFNFSKCKENLGMIRGVATSMLAMQEMWEFCLIQMYIQVYKYEMRKEAIIDKELIKLGERLV